MDDLYTNYPFSHINLYDKQEKFGTSIEAIFSKALQQIYEEQFDTKTQIQPDLFAFTFNRLSKAVDEGVKAEFGKENEEFIHQLRTSQKVFSAFKTHRQQNDIAKLLLNKKGELKPFAQFKNDVQQIVGYYNKNWLRTEYNTSIIRARMGAKFKQYQAEANIYPNLEWLPSTAPDPRESHKKFYHMIRPITDPFWIDHFPGNEWNCKCGITNTDAITTPLPEEYNKDKAPDGLDENPAFTGQIFSKSHPYFTETYPGAEKAVKTFIKHFKD